MKCVVEGDDFVRTLAVQSTPFTREFYRALICFRATIGKKYPIEPGCGRDHLRKARRRFVVKRRAAVDEGARLLVQGIDNFLWRMAQTVNRPSLNEIEITAALAIGQPGALTGNKHQFRPAGYLHQCV